MNLFAGYPWCLSLADCWFLHLATTSACGLSYVLVGFLYALTDRTPAIIPCPFPLDPCVLLLLSVLYWGILAMKNEMISGLHFYFGYSGNEKRNEFISAFYIGYSGNEKQNEFISAFYIGYSGNETRNDWLCNDSSLRLEGCKWLPTKWLTV